MNHTDYNSMILPVEYTEYMEKIKTAVETNNRTFNFYGGRGAALICFNVLTGKKLGISNYINDHDVYCTSRAGIREYKTEFFPTGFNKPIQIINRNPAAKILKSIFNRIGAIFYDRLVYPFSKKEIENTIIYYANQDNSYRNHTSYSLKDVLNTYDLNASQAGITWVESIDQWTIFYTKDVIDFCSTRELAFTKRQLAWFDMFEVLATSDTYVLPSVLKDLATHMLIVSTRFCKYATSHPGVKTCDMRSLMHIKNTLNLITEKGIMPISEESFKEALEKASSGGEEFVRQSIPRSIISTVDQLIEINGG